MKQEALEQRLEEYFESQKVEASSRLVYEARRRHEAHQKKQERMNYLRPLIYAAVLHVVWSMTTVGATFLFRGVGAALGMMSWNVIVSVMMIVGGCIVRPDLTKQLKEDER
ncbi:MAG: hypothetical protein ACRCW2_16185 [Cellulosilyticaceae bacterium]